MADEKESRYLGIIMEKEARIMDLEAALQPLANCGHHLLAHKFVPKPDQGIWVPRTTHEPQPPCILVKHLLDAAKALPSGSVSAPVETE